MHIQELDQVLRKNPLFGSLSEKEFTALQQLFSVHVYALGDTLVRRGDPGEDFYVIYSGRARVVDDTGAGDPITLAILNKGDSFGEQALLHRVPRARTVRAAGELVVLRIHSDDFDRFVSVRPEFRAALEEQTRRNIEFNYLRGLGILSQLTLPEIQRLHERLLRVSLAAGEILFREGDAGDRAFLVRDGSLRISKESNGASKQLAIRKAGDLVGEMSLLYGHPRSATAEAATDAVLLCLEKEVFEQIMSVESRRKGMMQQAADRLLQTETMLSAPETSEGNLVEAPELRVERVEVAKGWFPRVYPHVKVNTAQLSGLACLAMTAAHYRIEGPAAQDIEQRLREVEPETLLTVSRKAESLGLLTRIIHTTVRELPQVTLPGIITTDVTTGDHLELVLAASPRRVVVANPLGSVRELTPQEFSKRWDGRILSLNSIPKTSFGPIDKPADIVKQFLPFALPHLSLVGWIGAISLLMSLLGTAQPLLNKVIIDDVLITGDRSLLYLMIVGMLMVTAFQMLGNTLRSYLNAHMLRRISFSLQLRFLHHILSLPQKHSARWQTGEFLIRFSENDKMLQLLAEQGLTIAIDSITALMYVALLFGMSPQLAVPSSVFVVASAALMYFSSNRLRAIDRKIFDARQKTESHFIEAVSGIHAVKSLAIEPTLFQRGRELISRQRNREFKGAWLNFTLGIAGQALDQAATIVVLGYGAILALRGALTPGELVAFTALLGATMGSIAGLTGIWDKFQELRISFERTADVLKLEVEQNPKGAVAPVLGGHVLFQDVSFSYPGKAKPVFPSLNLEVLPGQKIAVVGRSGSGKTTLANLLTNLYEPTGGKIYFDRVDAANIHKQTLRRQVGIVEQQPYLFSGTIRENVSKADPVAGLESVVTACTLAGAHDFISELPMGYDTQIGERGMKLSGGQKQRLVIARAILTNPRILILDEATAALDTESERIIQTNLDRILAGKTAFIIAHRLSTIRNADRIVVLDEGKIVETGTHAELMEQRGLYHYLNTAGT